MKPTSLADFVSKATPIEWVVTRMSYKQQTAIAQPIIVATFKVDVAAADEMWCRNGNADAIWNFCVFHHYFVIFSYRDKSITRREAKKVSNTKVIAQKKRRIVATYELLTK